MQLAIKSSTVFPSTGTPSPVRLLPIIIEQKKSKLQVWSVLTTIPASSSAFSSQSPAEPYTAGDALCGMFLMGKIFPQLAKFGLAGETLNGKNHGIPPLGAAKHLGNAFIITHLSSTIIVIYFLLRWSGKVLGRSFSDFSPAWSLTDYLWVGSGGGSWKRIAAGGSERRTEKEWQNGTECRCCHRPWQEWISYVFMWPF